MILGARSFRVSRYTGFNIFLLKDWNLPISNLGTLAFSSFDETLMKLKSDPNSTRLSPINSSHIFSSELYTATKAALKTIPEKSRKQTHIYTVAFAKNSSGNLQMVYHLPAWSHMFSESLDGQLEKIDFKTSSGEEWFYTATEAHDKYFHLSFFSSNIVPQLELTSKPKFYRLSSAIERSSSPLSAVSLSLRIGQ